MFLHTRGRRGVNLGAMKRFVLIALLLTAWVVPAASDNPTKADFEALLKSVEKMKAAGPPASDKPTQTEQDAVLKRAKKLLKKLEKQIPKASDPTAVAWFDLVERNGVYFKKFSDVPFEGRLKYPESGAFRRGKPEGELILHRGHIRPVQRRSYSNGRPHGLWVNYHLDGNISSKLNYKNGKRHGPYIGFDSKGQLKAKGNYKNGKRDGAWEYESDNYGNVAIDPTCKGGCKSILNLQLFSRESGIYRNDERIACLPITPPQACPLKP